jgi:signal transduction histidine kinase/CheY-like chemotaxis protein
VATDGTAWLAAQLCLTLLEEGPDGRATSICGAPPVATTLAEALAELGNVDPAEHEAVQALIERARGGEDGAISVSHGTLRIVAWRHERGNVRALVAPGAPESVAQRAAVADVAAGVTHEVANALTAIAGWTRMAASGGPLPDRTRQALDVVQRSAREALGSARGLLRTMRDTGSDRVVANRGVEATDVALVVSEVIETLRPELEEAGIALEDDLHEGALAIVPPAALRLIVGNLVRNAFEALESGGKVRVAVTDHKDRLCVSVADDGPGMNGTTLARAFDRYFTTKEHGTGLGLALVRDTVHEAGGRLEVESRRGVGTRFDIWLPAADAPRMSMRPPQVVASSSGVHPKPALMNRAVLVVDDDEAIRLLVRTTFELQGARVTAAATRGEALEHEGPFALALVDLSLGDGRGDELIAELRAHRRIEYAILITGDAEPDLAPAGEPDALVRKPFELDELARTIELVLERGLERSEEPTAR